MTYFVDVWQKFWKTGMQDAAYTLHIVYGAVFSAGTVHTDWFEVDKKLCKTRCLFS
jgi:hypothetical protein